MTCEALRDAIGPSAGPTPGKRGPVPTTPHFLITSLSSRVEDTRGTLAVVTINLREPRIEALFATGKAIACQEK